MPLDEFESCGAQLEVRVPWLDATLWLVPTERDAAALMMDGIARGRIWTAAELMRIEGLLSTSGQLEPIAKAKLLMDGEVDEVRRP